jgi:hypothetical protein
MAKAAWRRNGSRSGEHRRKSKISENIWQKIMKYQRWHQ